MNSGVKTAIIFTNYGPYHISRVENLKRFFHGIVYPIQLLHNEKIRAWRIKASEFQVLTVVEKPLEEATARELKNGLISILDKIYPDVVIIAGYSHPAMRNAAIWAKQNKKLCILMSDTQYIDRPRSWIKEKFKGYFIKRHFDAAFVGGARASEYLERLGFPSDRIWRGYDVIDNNYFKQKSEEVRQSEIEYRRKLNLPEKYFLYVGRFSPEKNLLRLLEAYRKYKNLTGKNVWGLVMVGSGPQESQLKNHAKKLGLDEIIWTGFKQIDELSLYYALASCFILPGISIGIAFPASPGCALFRKSDAVNGLLEDIPNDLGLDFQKTGAGIDLLLFLITAIKYPYFGFILEPLSHFRDHREAISRSEDLSMYYWYSKKYFVDNFLCDKVIIKKFYTKLWLANIKNKNKYERLIVSNKNNISYIHAAEILLFNIFNMLIRV